MAASNRPTAPLSRDYWKLALDAVDPALVSSLNLTKTKRHDVLAAVLRTCEDKRALCMQKRWRFKKPSGDVIFIRDVLEKITKWVDRFREVGDAAVQFDMSHASLPWAGVRFLLQATVNDVGIFGAMATNLETISRLIASYQEFEQLHIQQGSAVGGPLEESLTRLYAAILTFLAEAVRYYHDSTAIRISKSPFRSMENPHMQRVLAQESEVLKLAGLADTERLLRLQTVMMRLSDQATVSEKFLQESKYRELVNWLSPTRFYQHHADHSERRLAETGQWLLDHPKYRQWRTSSSSSILLVHGIPGCGKSMLTSKVIDSLLSERLANPATAPFAYFYCADYEAEPERRQPEDILRSIVRQLGVSSQPPRRVRDTVLSEYERRQAEAEIGGCELLKLQVSDSLKLTLALISTDPVTIVVDAVDEVQEKKRFELLNALHQLVFITSRDNNHVLALLPDASKIRVQTEGNQKDVKYFVRDQVDRVIQEKRLLNGCASQDLRDDVVKTLIDGAGEMFLWVTLQIEYLCHMKHEQDIISTIRKRNLTNLDGIFAYIVTRILESEKVGRDIAIRVFSCLLFTKKPLTATAIISAVCLSSPTNQPPIEASSLLDVCFNLVVIDPKSMALRFAHQSAQEFIRTKAIFSELSAQRLLASSCLHVCMQGPPDHNNAVPLLEGTFYRYGTISRLVIPSNGRFINDNDGADESLSYIIWLDYAKQFAQELSKEGPKKHALNAISSSNISPLFTASVFGLEGLLNLVSSRALGSLNWNQKNLNDQTGLYLAAAFGHDLIVSRFIREGADIEITCGEHGSALAAACFAGHTAVIEFLLARGASARSDNTFSNALEAAFHGSHENIALLVLKSGYVCSQSNYDAALQGAAQAGFLNIVVWL
ncbi:uncharacterized protein K452DRAFT_358125 [Aplosporella prunicola CBS 121167]|uniref:Uncharacterized protein n=1 Tax=Aplosporella prunicola CBS 121167 TaxID=1176127 RepID=A0A6A6BDY4_9PEZI|nr:uncharacterized protein K452DRAFT_358125 [Aplosporella prunicola CBS 121167]KAF2142286.1 hypothetical protein K452DRAFT_358125 [Aplosporella prunicola CBS 121167]